MTLISTGERWEMIRGAFIYPDSLSSDRQLRFTWWLTFVLNPYLAFSHEPGRAGY